jgi:hypothetical protein
MLLKMMLLKKVLDAWPVMILRRECVSSCGWSRSTDSGEQIIDFFLLISDIEL